jgi:hypothetical protein
MGRHIILCLPTLYPTVSKSAVQASYRLSAADKIYDDNGKTELLREDFSINCKQIQPGILAKASQTTNIASVLYYDNLRKPGSSFSIGASYISVFTNSQIDLAGLDANVSEVASDLGAIGCSAFNVSNINYFGDISLGVRQLIQSEHLSVDLGASVLVPPNQTRRVLEEKRSLAASFYLEPAITYGRVSISTPAELILSTQNTKLDHNISVKLSLNSIALTDAEASVSFLVIRQEKQFVNTVFNVLVSSYSDSVEARFDATFGSGLVVSVTAVAAIAGRNSLAERAVEVSLGYLN